MKALAAYNATEEGELTLKQGEVVLVHGTPICALTLPIRFTYIDAI